MKYEWYIDRKIIEWERTYVSVEAETEEEAIQKCLKEDYKINSIEALHHTQKLVEPIDEPTFEIYDKRYASPIYDNYKW